MKNKEIEKMVNDYDNEYYSTERFIQDAKRYIKAIKERRMIVSIFNVSKSGNLKVQFLSCEKNNYNNEYYYCNYFQFLSALGYRFNKDNEMLLSFGNMDMIFNTNYNVIHKLKSLGIITKKTCDILAQKTPQRV